MRLVGSPDKFGVSSELRKGSVHAVTHFLRASPEGSQALVALDLKHLESCFEQQHAIPEG